jgi:hypothetical protein
MCAYASENSFYGLGNALFIAKHGEITDTSAIQSLSTQTGYGELQQLLNVICKI